MRISSKLKDANCVSSGFRRLLVSSLVVGASLQAAAGEEFPNIKNNWQAQHLHYKRNSTPPQKGPPGDWHGKVPLVITNNCEDTIWPGIATQAGTGPGTGGFELASGNSSELWVSGDWQGRIWGRTNCTVDGDSCSCKTGDCFSKLDCEFSVSAPGSIRLEAVLTTYREQLLQHSPSSLWRAVFMVSKRSTTSLSSTVTISPLESIISLAKTQPSFHPT